MLKPALARGELHCIGATTLDEYRKYVEKDAALERRFQPVLVGEPKVEDTVSILRGLKERYAVHHGVEITDPAIVAAATLSNRYIADRQLPDKAIDLMDEAASRIRMEIDSKPEYPPCCVHLLAVRISLYGQEPGRDPVEDENQEQRAFHSFEPVAWQLNPRGQRAGGQRQGSRGQDRDHECQRGRKGAHRWARESPAGSHAPRPPPVQARDHPALKPLAEGDKPEV